MFLLFLSEILSYQHVIVIPAYGTYEFGEKLDTKLASELMFDITLVSKGSLNYKLYKPNQPRSGLEQFLPLINNKYREKYNVDGDYVIVVENPDAEPMMASIGSYIDLDQKDEDLSLLTSMLNKSKINLDNLVNANIRLKELKEFSLRNAKKDRNWMLLLCVMPVIYVLVGFVSLKMQKAFFAPKNRK